MRRRWGPAAAAWSLVAVLLPVAAGCDRTPAPEAGATTADKDAPDVVAVVDGRAIRTADVRRQAKAAGVSPRAALEQLIESELVVAAARRRGLEREATVIAARDQVMVRRLLATTFEREVTSAAVPAAEIERQYQRNLSRFDHPELVEVSHILAPRQEGDSPARLSLLRARAEQVAQRAREVRSRDEFAAIATALSEPALALRHETLVTDAERTTVKEFADAAFALRQAGDVSGVVATTFGWHVIYLAKRIPAEHRSLRAVKEEIREALWPALQRREFARFVDQRMEQHQVVASPALLEGLP